MKRYLLPLALAAAPLGAQEVTLGAEYHVADYREQAALLEFRGAGPGGWLDAEYRRFGLRIEARRLTMTDRSSGDLEDFDLTQLDVRVRARVLRNIGLEAGMLKRAIAPERAAQEVGAVRFGAYARYDLAPGADLTVRAGYLGATKFSGGGTAPFGVEVGLAASYGPGSGRVRATGGFEFQRFDRHTDVDGERLSVPIQIATARIGLSFTF